MKILDHTRKAVLVWVLLLSMVLLSACVQKKPPLSPAQPPPQKQFRPVPDDSQLSQKQLKEASTRYGGSMNAVVEPPNLDRASVETPGDAEPAMPRQPSLVLGPVWADSLSGKFSHGEASQKIREIITGVFTRGGKVIVVDAPEERYKNDFPRPDLAARGIRYVVKGVVSFNKASGQNTVFLRAVRTSTGKVKAVASARHTEKDQAAHQAAGILMKRLEF